MCEKRVDRCGSFEVTDHFQIADRGAFVIGRIAKGRIGIGMYAETRSDPSVLKISGVECLDNLADRKHWNALVFEERPTLEFLRRVFPVGCFIVVMDTLEST